MIKRLLILLLILIPLGGYLWYRQTPEQQVLRSVDQLVSNLEHRRISTRRPVDVAEALKEVLAPTIKLGGVFPIPTDEMSIDNVIEQVALLHSLSNSCEITEVDRSIQIVGTRAQVIQTSTIEVSYGVNGRNKETWEVILDLEKGEDWRIVGIRGHKM